MGRAGTGDSGGLGPVSPPAPIGEDSIAPEPHANHSLLNYVDAVASDRPAPGGGSVVGVVGALAAALGEMVGNLTTGRADDPAAEARVRESVGRASALRARFLELSAADEAAYGGYVAATRLPKGTEAEKATRRAAKEEALHASADVPLAVAGSAIDLLGLLETVAHVGNRHLLTDVTVATLLAEAALRGALANARANAALMRDTQLAGAYRSRAAEAEAEARRRAAVVTEIVAAREG